MNIFDEFPSKFLKASDVDADRQVTMTHVVMDDIGDDRKPILFFQEFEKGLVLNKTNSTNIANLYGPDTNNWTGQRMTMASAMTDFQGKSTPCLRVYPPRGGAVAQTDHKAQGAQTDDPFMDDPRGDAPPPASENDYGAQR